MTTTDPERAFVGAVLQLPADAAQKALDLIRDEDIGDPRLRVVVAVARQLVEAGMAPDPVAVLAHARSTGTVTRADAVRNFSLLVSDTYAQCPTPASVRFYAAAVLEEALRRRSTEMAVRIGQAADGESIESLVGLVDGEVQAVRELRARREIVVGNVGRLRLATPPGVSA